MKKIIFSITLLISVNAFAQNTAAERDSVAQTAPFQLKVKMKSLSAANDLLADPNQPVYVTRYAQIVITEPNGNGWLPALSYGVMNNPAINAESSEGDIQFTVNSIFVKYAKAYYRIVDTP